MKVFKSNSGPLTSAIVALFVVLSSPSAHAVLELRGNFGLVQATPTDLNTKVSTTSGSNDLNLTGATMYGADAIFKFPMSHIGIGVRYENWDQKKTTANYGSAGISGSNEMTMSRWAGILTIRPIDTLVYLGLIGTYGISQEIHDIVGPTSSLSDYKNSAGTTYSAGVEGGFKMGFLRLGAEVGYESVSGTGMTSTTNSSSKTSDLNMAGTYGRISLGFGI